MLPTSSIGRVLVSLAIAVGIPLGGVTLVDRYLETEQEVLTFQDPIFVRLGSTVDSARQPASFKLTWTLPMAFEATTSGGLVTSVAIGGGETIIDGGRVLAVDGVDRLLYVAASPFHRTLQLGDRGSDAQALKEWLRRRGFLDVVTAESIPLGRSDAQAIRSLQLDIGSAETSWGVFDPAWTIFSTEPLQVDDIVVKVGDLISPNTPFVLGSTAAMLSEVEVVPAGEPAQARRLGERDLLVRLPESDNFIEFGGLNTTDPALLATVAASVTGTEESLVDGGFVQLASAIKFATVPSMAVLTGTSGELCVLLGDSLEELEAVMVLTTESGQPGLLLIDPDLAGSTVLANPLAIRPPEGNPACE